MKNLKTVTIILASLFLVMGSSCKYEESGLSLRGKKARVVNTWKFETPESGDEGTRIKFEKDGAGSTYDVSAPSMTNKFTWEFDDSKENLILDGSDTIKIYKLKHKELWLGDEKEVELKLIAE